MSNFINYESNPSDSDSEEGKIINNLFSHALFYFVDIFSIYFLIEIGSNHEDSDGDAHFGELNSKIHENINK